MTAWIELLESHDCELNTFERVRMYILQGQQQSQRRRTGVSALHWIIVLSLDSPPSTVSRSESSRLHRSDQSPGCILAPDSNRGWLWLGWLGVLCRARRRWFRLRLLRLGERRIAILEQLGWESWRCAGRDDRQPCSRAGLSLGRCECSPGLTLLALRCGPCGSGSRLALLPW